MLDLLAINAGNGGNSYQPFLKAWTFSEVPAYISEHDLITVKERIQNQEHDDMEARYKWISIKLKIAIWPDLQLSTDSCIFSFKRGGTQKEHVIP